MRFFASNRINAASSFSVIFRLFVLVRAGSWLIILLFFAGCFRSNGNNEDASGLVTWSGAYPMAILQTGGHPLWFVLTEEGPVHIGAIEDSVYTSPLIPWPYALHICSLAERGGEIVMVVNRDGFLKLAPNSGTIPGLALYHFPGGDFWRQYTVGGFVFYNGQPAVTLYLDDRFLSLDISPPRPRTWSFNMNSNLPFTLDFPSFRLFPEEEGWNVDTLRFAGDGLFYYRAAIRNESRQSVRMFRTADLAQTGEEISAGVFFNSAPRRTEIFHPSLPPLPEGFVYTELGRIGDSLFAVWEEQADFSIGSAGFVAIRQGAEN